MRILILGAGDIGHHIALNLSREHREVVLIESSPERAARIEEDENDIQVILGNAADPDLLIKAGLNEADLLVAVTDSDEVNLASCLFASRLAPEVRRIARMRHIDTRRHGALLTSDPPVVHSIINPEELCARKIRDLIRFAGATDVNWFFDARVALVRTPVLANSPVKGLNLIELGQTRETAKLPFLVAMLVRDGVPRVPAPEDVLRIGDQIYAVTLAEHLNVVLDVLCHEDRRREARNVAVFGGGGIGLYLAELLETDGTVIKLVEPDEQRAAFLANRLNTTLVLCGEPLDPAIFEEERIAGSDVFVAATGDQENNIIAALYAKSHGVRMGISVLKRAQIERLVSQVGIDAVILPQHAAIGKILAYVREGEITSVIVVNENDMEVIELRVPEGARIAGRPLREVRMPRGALLLAVAPPGGKTIVPGGATVIRPGDRIAVIAHKRDVRKLERLLAGAHGWGPRHRP